MQQLWVMIFRRGLMSLVRKIFGVRMQSPRRPSRPRRPGKNNF